MVYSVDTSLYSLQWLYQLMWFTVLIPVYMVYNVDTSLYGYFTDTMNPDTFNSVGYDTFNFVGCDIFNFVGYDT